MAINQTGRRYGGRYSVERSIASGGMAEVFAARDELLERTVALKLMHPEFARDPTFINRFRREAQAAASLNDPRVVSIYDWGADDGDYYIVMEYVEGRTLREIVENEGPLSPERAVEIAADVCGALHLAHEKGVVHRDIKSANIAVTTAGQVKIMDFGIARAAAGGNTMTQTGSVLGTANYLSPEQAQGMPVDARSDIYSVGVVLYEMLTRDLPFKGDSAVAIAYKHVQENPSPPSQLNHDISGEVDAVVLKALAKNADNRYQSAQEMQTDLKRLLTGEQVEATPILPPEQTVAMQSGDRTTVMPAVATDRAAGRRRAIAYAFATLFVISILGLLGALLFSTVDQSEPKVVVPNVVNQAQEDAERVLESKGLDARIERRDFSDTVEAGFVISQDPEEGLKADKGTRVSLVISKGAETVEVPALIGKSRPEAEQLLVAAGLALGEVKERADDAAPAGRVLDQSPDAGLKIDRGSPVTLVISRGQDLIKVPDVVGDSQQKASSRIEDAGLKVEVKESCESSSAEETVTAQNPAASKEVAKGTVVTLTVNKGSTVPSVQGDDEEEATEDLVGAGFRVVVASQPSLGNEGKVLSQNPAGESVACRGSQVRIVVGRSVATPLFP